MLDYSTFYCQLQVGSTNNHDIIGQECAAKVFDFVRNARPFCQMIRQKLPTVFQHFSMQTVRHICPQGYGKKGNWKNRCNSATQFFNRPDFCRDHRQNPKLYYTPYFLFQIFFVKLPLSYSLSNTHPDKRPESMFSYGETTE